MPDETASQWKILIVDDDTDNLDVASQYLEFIGAEVRTARSAREGLAVLESFAPTFILLDLSMPGIDGWDMFKQIRALPNMEKLPIIAVTAHAMQDDVVRAVEVGFDGYITKPFILTSLLGDIKSCLAQSARFR